MQNFIQSHVEKIKPLLRQARLAHWQASVSGDASEYEKLQNLELEIRKIYSNKDEFFRLKKAKEQKEKYDPLLNRQIDILYRSYVENQIAPDLMKKMVILSTAVEREFSTFRSGLRGKSVTSNEIDEILKTSKDPSFRREAWLASKQVGEEVGNSIVDLVKLRNEAAQGLGFGNYYLLSLTIAEQEIGQLDAIFSRLFELTSKPFSLLKSEIDDRLAQKYQIAAQDVMPWHYHDPFFQDTPQVFDLNLDKFYLDKNVVELASRFYYGIGLPVEAILEKSDLFEREGKNPHAFCTNIDREGDVRILCNVKNNERWMETMLHELGHAVYDRCQNPGTPFLLRTPAHIFTTEAIAMLFGRLSRNACWMRDMIGLSERQQQEINEMTMKYTRYKQLIFVRWAMVMFNFEKQLYENPDHDLNHLWWRMVEKFQFIAMPEERNHPDWAAKIHFAIAPCYYHNYVLGELLASQLHHFIGKEILHLRHIGDVTYVGKKSIGDFLRQHIFKPGSIYKWDEMIQKATNEPLNPQYFIEQFVE